MDSQVYPYWPHMSASWPKAKKEPSPMDKMEKNRQWAIDNDETWALQPRHCRLCKRPYEKE